jgi:hypothetical protein
MAAPHSINAKAREDKWIRVRAPERVKIDEQHA